MAFVPTSDSILASARQLLTAGRWREARPLLEALSGDPACDPAIVRKLAEIEDLQGDTGRALARLLDLRARLRVASASLELQVAHLATRAGNATMAIDALGRAVSAAPRDAPTWTRIGHLYGEHTRYPEAQAAFDQASALDPGSPDIEPLRAVVKQELGDDAGALRALALAAARAPDDPRVAFAERLYLPQAYDNAQDVAQWRKRYADGLAALRRDRDRWMPRAADVFALDRTNFFLAYQGENDLELQRGYSTLLGELAAAAAPQLASPLPIRYDGRRRLRVGFLGNMFRESTAGRYFERWITGLDASRFERFVYHTAPVADAFTRRIASVADHFFDERLDNRGVAGRVRADALDVLVYPEVGMSSMTYVLAALRLAPVQCAGWGHPVTTGSAAIDHFFTCGDMEPPDGERHYTERLVKLPGIGVDYAMPEPPVPMSRAQFVLPDEARVLACAQSLFKIHPDMDDLFARIVEADPTAVLVFFQAPSRAITDRVGARLQRALAARGVAPRGQVKFLPRLAGPHFRGVLSACDVVLDTTRWSGGNTSMDAFAAAVPVVTLEGRFMRARQTAAMLRMVGLEELVAHDADEYVRLALDVARDRERNAALREAIRGRRAQLFDRGDCFQAFQDALLAVGTGSR
jgi:CRISPR-associated protein Csy1